MDPVTHAVIGMTVAKITGNGIVLSEPATVGIVVGSVFPDIDILMQKMGDYVYLKNHRGATHSIFGLAVSAMFIALVLSGFYQGSSILNLFLWSMVGCLSHTFFDIFNSYGAKLFWPFYDKKFSLSLLIVFDPMLLAVLAGYVVSRGDTRKIFLGVAVAYLVSRVVMRLWVTSGLKRKFNNCVRISVLPSMTGLLRWHFILETKDYNIVGEKNVLRRGERIIKTLCKIQDEALDKILYSPVGEFFSEFTPLFHVACEKAGEITRYIFIDMRYYVRNKFLHHAVLEVDSNNSIVKETFHPYSMNRSNLISTR